MHNKMEMHKICVFHKFKMSLDRDRQSAKELVENLFIFNIRIEISCQVRKFLRKCSADSDGLAANASLRTYVVFKNKSLKHVIDHVESYFLNDVIDRVANEEAIFGAVAYNMRKYEDQLEYFYHQLINSCDESDDFVLRHLVMHRLAGSEGITLGVELFVDAVVRDERVLNKMKAKVRGGKMSRSEAEGMEYLCERLKKLMDEEVQELCRYFENFQNI